MFKRILYFLNEADAGPNNGQHSGEVEVRQTTQAHGPGEPDPLTSTLNSRRTKFADDLQPFEEIYKAAPAQPPQMTYGILKLAEMLNSSHLAGMSHESKRSSLMMAIEAAAVQVDDLLQDAMLRQRALNDYEASEEQRLKEFENAIDMENTLLHAELEHVTSLYMARVQDNMDEVASAQDRFRAWKKRKLQELQHMSNAAAICVPKGSEASVANPSYSAVLARVGLEQTAGAR